MKVPKPHIFFVICLIISVGFRISHRYHYRIFYPDTALMLQSHANYLRLGSPTFYQVEITDQIEIRQESRTAFPKGYVYALHVFQTIFQNRLVSSFFLDIVSIILWVGSSLYLISISHRKVWGWILMSAYCILSPTLLHPLPSSDLLALGLLSSSVSLLIFSLNKRGFTSNLWLLLSGTVLSATITLKFIYVPFLLIIPLATLIPFYLQKYPASLRKMIIFAIIPFTITMYTIISWLGFGQMPYFSDSAKSTLFFHHLTYIDPFPIKSFIYFNIQNVESLKNFLGVSQRLIPLGLLLGSSIIIALVLTTWYNWIAVEHNVSFNLLGWIFCSIAFGNICLISYSSITTPPETDWLDFWTFVMETRYFAPTQWTILLSFILSSTLASQSFRNRITSWILFSLFLIALMGRIVQIIYADAPTTTSYTFPEYDYDLMYNISDSLRNSIQHSIIYTTNKTRIPDAVGIPYISPNELENPDVRYDGNLTIIWISEYPENQFINIPAIFSESTIDTIYTHPLWSMYTIIPDQK